MADITFNKPELLCPAGSPEAFDAAIEAGADAIYLGLSSFNARINAHNFTPADISEATRRAHAYGVKVYVTLNTLVFDRETDEFLRTAESAYLGGVDALIVADIGSARLLHQYMPDMPLHASTQFSGHNVDAAKEMMRLGFSRMVCAREMSREDLIHFCKNSPIEAEVFVHGALCVCHSGQCLFSSLVGGRSGNRGECAQPCRLPYNTPKGKSDYPLSLKDLSLAAYADELADMGVASFKIEGRMKSPEYVRDVTRIWRRLIDEHRGADKNELYKLSEIFSRGGLTDGYYVNKIGKNMLGIRSADDKKNTKELSKFEGITRKIPVSLEVYIKRGEPSRLTVLPFGVSTEGAIPDEAINAPLTEDSVRKNISKLGATPYAASEIKIDLDEGLILPISALNTLRRDAIEKIGNKEERTSAFGSPKLPLPQKKQSGTMSAVFYSPSSITEISKDYFDIIYAPLHLYGGECNGVLLPPVIFDSESDEVRRMLRNAVSLGATHALCGNIGHLELAREAGLIPHADYRMNIASSRSALACEELGVSDMIVSPELSLAQIRDIGSDRFAIVYGKVPLMTLEKCVIKEISDCDTCTARKWIYLNDRRGVRFPVSREWKHRNIIFNSVPIYMADRKTELAKYKIYNLHFIFTDEKPSEVDQIITSYKNGLGTDKQIRRIK